MAGPSRRQEEGDEVEADWLKLIKTNHEVHVQVSDKVPLDGLPFECSLLAVSNLYDVLVVAAAQGIRIYRLSTFHQSLETAPRDSRPVAEPLGTIALPARPVWLRFAYGDERLIIATTAAVHICNTSGVVDGHMNSAATISNGLPSPILDILPNPAPVDSDGLAKCVAILGRDGVVMLDLDHSELGKTFGGSTTCACWSAKGKQIILGQSSGTLTSYTPQGIEKASIAPPDLDDPSYPALVQWLENDLFLVGYARSDSQPDDPLDIFTISRSKTEIAYTRFFDPINSMGFMGRSGLFRYTAALKQWGGDTKHLAFMMSGIASEVGVMRGTAEGRWEVLLLDETTRAIMPTGGAGSEDSSCIGMALDLTSQKAIHQGVVNGIDMPDLAPTPRLLLYTQEGYIISFDIRYPDGGAYPGMIQPQAAPAASTSMASTPQIPATPAKQPTPSPSPQPTTTPAAPPSASASASAATGGTAFGASAFGGSSTPKSGSGFGASAFGGSTTPQTGSGFGSSAFGGSSTPQSGSAFGASAFGKPSTPQGSTSSAFGGSAFGASAFGKSSTASSGSAFGSSGFGGSSSGTAFGQSGFGKSAFGASTGSAFGGSTTPSTDKLASALGQAASTTPAAKPPSAFGTGQSTTPASTPAASKESPAASGTSTPPAFGQSAFGSKPSAFGQSAFGSNTGQPSAFGQSSFGAAHSTGGFAGFGSKPATGSGSGFGGFGQPAAAKPAFGASAFGKVAAGSGSAFGGSSAFGTSSVFGTTTATAKIPAEAQPKDVASKDSKATEDLINEVMGQADLSDEEDEDAEGEEYDDEQDEEAGEGADQTFVEEDSGDVDEEDAEEAGGFSLGGFGAALNTSSTQKTGASHSSMQHSPPSAPAFGIKKSVPGLDDDDDGSPPNSPPVKAKSAFPSQTSAGGTSSSSSYIKPSTAFGASTSTGAFGSTPTGTPKTAAFSTTPSSTPSAFSGTSSAFGTASSSTPTKPSAGAATSAFGQSSSVNKTGFGSSGFGSLGQPKQSAFATTPGSSSTSSGFGNISGGFGGFASKPAGMAPIASTGGFAGFGGAAKGGASAFGVKAEDKGAAKTGGGFFGFGGSGSTGFGGSTGGKSIFDTDVKADTEARASPAAFGLEKGTAMLQAREGGQDAGKGKAVIAEGKQSAPKATATPEAAAAIMPAGYDTSSSPADPAETAGLSASLTSTGKAAEVPLPGLTPLAEVPPGNVESEKTDSSSPKSPKTPSSTTSIPDEHRSDGSVGSDRSESTGEHITAADAEPDEDEEGELVQREDAGEDTVKATSQDSRAELEREGEAAADEEQKDIGGPDGVDAGAESEDSDGEGSEEDSEELSESEEEVHEELPSITEADEEEEEEEEVTDAGAEVCAPDKPKDGLKSPPTWFAKQVPSPAGSASTGTDKSTSNDTTSLFARLSPSAAAPSAESPATKDTGKLSPTPFSFASPHAVRAASPLGSQPPTNAENDGSDTKTRVKQEEDVKPVSNSLSAPKPVEVKQTFGAPAATGSAAQPSLFGAVPAPKSVSHAADQEKAQPDVKPFSGFGFGQQQPAPIASAAKAAPAPDAPAEAPKSKPFDFGGLGLGKPSAPATTAPASVDKPATGSVKPSYGLSDIPPVFGAAKATEPVKSAASGFSGFGSSAAVPAASSFGSSFGSVATKPTSASTSAASPFGQPSPWSFAQAEAPAAPATSTLGSFGSSPALGATSAASGTPAQAQSDSACTMPSSTRPVVPASAASGKPAAWQPTAPSAPARAYAPPRPVDHFDMPQRSNIIAAPHPTPAGRSGTMGDIVDGKVKDLKADIDNLKSLIAAASRFHSAFSASNFVPINQDNIGNHDMLPFDKAGDVSVVISQVIKGLMADRVAELQEEKLVLDLQAIVAKSDVKKHQLDKLIEARDKPSEIYTTTGLDAEQETSQINLRAATAEVEARLMELEAGLRYLRERSQSMRAAESSVSEMPNSFRTAESTIMNRQQTIEDLSRRMNTVRLGSASSPSRQTSASPQSSPFRDFLNPMPNFSRAPRELKVPAKVNEEVKAALSKQSKIQAFAAKKKGNSVRVLSEDSVMDSENIADIDVISLPKAAPIMSESFAVTDEVKQEEQAAPITLPAPPISAPGSVPAANPFANISFGNIKLNVGPVAATRPSSGRGASGAIREQRKTSHAPPKYVPSAAADKPAAPKSGFSFGFPQTAPSPSATRAPDLASAPASDADTGSPAGYTFE